MMRHLLKVLLVLLFSPCLLCLGGGAYIWGRETLREGWGIGMGNSRWMPVGPEEPGWGLHDEVFVGDHSAFITRHWDARSSALWRMSRHGVRLVSFFDGIVLDLSSARGAWFGVLSKPVEVGRSDERIYQVIRSVDEGDSWEVRGVLPQWGELLAVSPREVWALSDWMLVVSTDGGQTFSNVALAGKPDFLRDRLVPGPNGTVWLLGPSGLFRLSDQGRTWTYEPMPEAVLQAGDGGVLAGRVGEWLAIRRDAPGEEWRPITDQPHYVRDLAVSGDTVRVLTYASDPFKDGGGYWYHHSEDGGRTWEHVDTGLLDATIHGLEWGVGAEFRGRLFGHVPGGMFTQR
ncbi:putative BNR domain protein [Cystobacter fuscus DSM 2262]|uniref:BNR domain protein n=1 Tax=Cystobacter fuscus (strain ATCC 25194 / DSM 2262 / NBRC 100088 / M29) TaxID=1242864 RepID=S9P044_CYSF2|nr:hypothetical protein [Cystobacter fuscus]EPX57820.1 putative BNR domain protein [Cystobacter fuscus DSM 2262]